MTNTKLKDSLYETIDVIVEKRIEDLHLDKTIICNIITCLNDNEGKYKVSYAGGEMIAYAKNGETYNSNIEVYVTIPQGNFSNRKWIVGTVYPIETKKNYFSITKFNDAEAALDPIKQKINEIIDIISNNII